jgi:arginyl-tRNA synthetase
MRATAKAIAVSALRYFLLKFTRNSVIAFDFKEAVSFEGETGPYCQYAAVRANNIFRKLGQGEESSANEMMPKAQGGSGDDKRELARVFAGESGDEIWSLVLLAARLEETIRQAAEATEPATLAKYTFNLARAFNLFYHRHHILKEEDPVRRAALIMVADVARRQLTTALDTLGIAVPERM